VVAAAGRQEGAGAAENGISLGPGGRRGGEQNNRHQQRHLHKFGLVLIPDWLHLPR